MLDKTTIKFLEHLNEVNKLKRTDFFNYFEEKNIHFFKIIELFSYLKSNNFMIESNDYIYSTQITTMYLNSLSENRKYNFYINHISPYIQQIIIYLLGLLSPYLIKFLEQILKHS